VPVGFFEKLKAGLSKTTASFMDKVTSVMGLRRIDEELFEELEEALITADVGAETAYALVEELRKETKRRGLKEGHELQPILAELISERLGEPSPLVFNPSGLTVILVVGVNGVGKTTTIGKLAHYLKGQGKQVVLAAGDTFRAAAIDQLKIWGERAGVPVVAGPEGGDPAAVAYDGIKWARETGADVLIMDTAGRLHNRADLMAELKKMTKVLSREAAGAPHETLLVLDATTGQNAIQQTKLFKEVAGVTAIALTKLDGTAKGGVVIGINAGESVPVKLVGVGEGIDDLQPFNPQDFAKALFGQQE
jgi:fused signal recognition particle receptor